MALASASALALASASALALASASALALAFASALALASASALALASASALALASALSLALASNSTIKGSGIHPVFDILAACDNVGNEFKMNIATSAVAICLFMQIPLLFFYDCKHR